ncbi:F-box domain [Arabidopsis suecica]|uniref:F-box domain n=1 Tax=Arabidopsis suecica TaxID=45249 RepID=A0A8T2B1J5_ARASU|nr:F-box domain [Arabidopsis suecica]
MAILNLPRDLIEEIVSRVPLKYMRAVRLTCKTLNALSQSSSFMKLHIGKEAAAIKEGETRMIMLMDCNLYLISVFFKGVDIDPYIEHKGKLTCLNDSDQVTISQVFYCEGLVLCIFKDSTRFVVWNPYLGQTRWIKPSYSHRRDECDSFSYALGYEDKKSCRSYKLLRFIDYFRGVPERQILCYEIYDFDYDLWTTLDVTPHWRIVPFGNRGVSLEGNTYFCASERNSEVDGHHGHKDHIICFDYTKERFGPLLPLPFSAGYDDYVTLSCVREEKLAALLMHNEVNLYEFDIWITTKIDAEKISWSKFLTVDSQPAIPNIRGSFFIDEEKKVVMGLNKYLQWNHHTLDIIGVAGYFRALDLPEPDCRNCWPHVCAYDPSSVQIKPPAGSQVLPVHKAAKTCVLGRSLYKKFIRNIFNCFK